MPPLRQRWVIPFPTTPLGQLPSTPVLADGRLFVLEPDIENGEAHGFLIVCYDAVTASPIWGPIHVRSLHYSGYLCYDRGTLLVLSIEGTLSAINGETGRAIWTRELGELSFSSPPTVFRGIVYVLGPESVLAILTSTGQVLWGWGPNFAYTSSAAVNGNGVYILGACLQTWKLRTATGKQKWYVSFNCTGGGGEIPVLYDGKLYIRGAIGANPEAKILDPSNGGVVGTHPGGLVPAFANGRGFFVTSDGVLKAVDAKTNEVLWRFAGDGTIHTAPHVIDGLVYVGSRTGQLYVIDASGNLVWSTWLGAPAVVVLECCGRDFVDIAAWDGLLVVVTKNGLIGLESESAQPTYDTVLQDDKRNDWLAINTMTGEFMVGGCQSGATARGVGVIARPDAGVIVFKAQGDTSITATLNTLSKTAKAKVTFGASGARLSIRDGNTADSSVQCP